MRLHRFFVRPDDLELTHDLWVHDQRLLNQWLRVLRYRVGDQLVLFDGERSERLYRIEEIEKDGVHLNMVTDFERKLPGKHVYLFFSLLKKDKNDWVLQKGTELGVRNFVPVLAARSEKTGFNLERAEKIVIEAAEQCGRSDIPQLREPVLLETAFNEYSGKVQLLVCHEGSNNTEYISDDKPVGVFIGPEGGWTKEELALFDERGLRRLQLGELTLRAETAAITVAAKLLVA